ncbi:MAG: hypothetical protein ABSG19_09510 [Candidatus Aminicenantales bacterium]
MNRLSHRLCCAAFVIAFVLQLVPSGLARAQETAALSDDQVKERLNYIESVLKAGQPRAGTWYYGWIAAYSVGAVGGGILAGSHWTDKKEDAGGETVPDREFAEGMLVGGATFVLGVGALVINPFTPATAAKKLGRLPGNTAGERQEKLRQAEDLLRKCARREMSGRSLGTHVLNIAGNAAAGVVTKTVFHQSWTNALIAFAGGEAISLLNIFTQPMRATRDLNEYEAKYLGQRGASALAPQERKWTLSAWPGGLTFRLEF